MQQARERNDLRPVEPRLEPPPVGAQAIPRTALVNRLRVAGGTPVVTVVAPAGYGKTTLLAQWARRDERPFAWYTVDEADDDPLTLLGRLALAVDECLLLDPFLFDSLAVRSSDVHRRVAALGRIVADLGDPLVLVLDDVHRLGGPTCLSVLSTLVDHLQPGSQLVLAGRAEPRLPLARWRAEGRLAEFGIDELQLTERESHALLRAAGVDLTGENVRELHARVEGWPAGMYLEALALRAGSDRDATGDAPVDEYLRHRLLPGLEAAEVEFLERAAVLDRMCGPLCDHALGRSGSALLLEELERTNLFLVPLDRERRWYRFHHLFRDLLREELERREPGLARRLLARAADWYEAADDPASALEYADRAGDRDRVVALFNVAALPGYLSGRIALLERWLSHIDDPDLLVRHQGTAVLGAWTHALLGHAAAADAWADVVDRAEPEGPMPDGSPSSQAWAANLRAAMCRRGVERMLDDACFSSERLGHGSRWRASSAYLAGVAQALRGDVDAADAALAGAVEIAESMGTFTTLSMALAWRARLARAGGDVREAENLAERAKEAVHEAHLEGYATSALALAVAAREALRRADWQRAEADLDRACRLAPATTYVLPVLAVTVRLELAAAQLSLANAAAATDLLDQVDGIFERCPDLGSLRGEAAELRARLGVEGRGPGRLGTGLTPAELRLLPLLATHLSFREIAERLFVSRNTVKTEAISIYRKLGVSSRSEALRRAAELGLLTSGVELLL
jgi:LuxR family maltose regulon positive regulatory protein